MGASGAFAAVLNDMTYLPAAVTEAKGARDVAVTARDSATSAKTAAEAAAASVAREQAGGTAGLTADGKLFKVRIPDLRGDLAPQLVAVAGDATVVDGSRPVGDVRRYGVIPGDTDTSPTDQGNRLIAAINAHAALGIVTHIPAGYYRCGLNVNVSGARLRIDPGAEFGGIIHIGSNDNGAMIADVQVVGPLVTYDRFGVYRINRLTFDTALCKADGAKNVPNPGSRGRGCHIYNGATDVRGREVVIEDMDAASPGADAAFAVDGNANNPQRISIGRVHVKKSDIHGVYLTGAGHQFADIIVDEYGSGAYAGAGLQDAAVAQSANLAGFWSNRCMNTRVGRLSVGQGAGSRPNAKFDVLVDETSSTTGTVQLGSIAFGVIHARNVRDVSRGVCFGDPAYPKSYNALVVDVESIRVDVEAGRVSPADTAAVNIGDGAVVTVGGAIRAFSTDLRTDVVRTESGTVLTVGLIDAGSFKANVLRALGKVYGAVTGVRTAALSATTIAVELLAAGAAFSRLAVDLTGTSVQTVRALNITAPDVTIVKLRTPPTGTGAGAVSLAGADRLRLNDAVVASTGATGSGIVVSASVDMLWERVDVSGFAKGIAKTGTVSGVAIGVKSAGNTTQTDMPIGTMTEVGCTGLQV